MRALIAATSLIALTACGGAAPAQEATISNPVTPPAPRDNCTDIALLATAMSEPEPFASLRTGNVMLDDYKVEDSFTTNVQPAGAQCQLGKMSGWNPGDPDMYVANCGLFSAGVFDEEENGAKAKAAFDAARAQLDKCLPTGWASRDGGNNGDERTESLIYETAADKARSESADFYAFPIEHKKAYDSQGNLRGGRAPGWAVTLNFQMSGAKPQPTDGATSP
jgi:hypothetical protein